MNISSVILHVAPDHLAAACAELASRPGIEVHAHSAEGKVVVTVEDSDTHSAADSYVALHGVPGVAAVAMVYQYSDDVIDSMEVEA